MSGVLVVANRPLSDFELWVNELKAKQANMSIVVVKVPNDPERTVFLTDIAKLWCRHFSALE